MGLWLLMNFGTLPHHHQIRVLSRDRIYVVSNLCQFINLKVPIWTCTRVTVSFNLTRHEKKKKITSHPLIHINRVIKESLTHFLLLLLLQNKMWKVSLEATVLHIARWKPLLFALLAKMCLFLGSMILLY